MRRIGLVASATFLIAALSAFQIDPSQDEPRKSSGNGGFALVAETDQPVYRDLDTPNGRAELGFSNDDYARLADATLISLRVKPGDDASCLNLYRPRQPRVLGIPSRMIERGGFAWAGSTATTDAQKANPWLLLQEELEADPDGRPLVPVVLALGTRVAVALLSPVKASRPPPVLTNSVSAASSPASIMPISSTMTQR